MNRKEALEILGFGSSDNPSEREITIAYRRLALKVHPDHHQNEPPDIQKQYEEKFKQLSSAYEFFTGGNEGAKDNTKKSTKPTSEDLNINSAGDLKFRLYTALFKKNIVFLKKLFSKFKSNKNGRFGDYINERFFRFDLPLFSAIFYGNVELVRLLLDNGADLNVLNKYGKSPLHKACSGGHASIVKLLLEKDVDPNAQDKGGESPLHKACFSGYYNIVKLLLEKGVDPNAQDEGGKSPLHKARSKGHDGIVKLLLEHGAKSDLKDKDDKKPTGRVSPNLKGKNDKKPIDRVSPCSDGGKPFNSKKAFWLGVAALLATAGSIALASGVADAYIGEVWCSVLAAVIAVIALYCACCAAKTRLPPSGPSTELYETSAEFLNSQRLLSPAGGA